MKNAKRKGAVNEHRTMRLLEAAGYACTRSSASLGVFDVIAIGPDDILGVQVKSNRIPSPAEREQMRRFRAPGNFRRLVHVWCDRETYPRVLALMPTATH